MNRLETRQKASEARFEKANKEASRKTGDIVSKQSEKAREAEKQALEARLKIQERIAEVSKDLEETRTNIKSRINKRFELVSRMEKEYSRAIERKQSSLVDRAERAVFAFAEDLVSRSQGEISAFTVAQMGRPGTFPGEFAKFATMFTTSPVLTFAVNAFDKTTNNSMLPKNVILARYLAETLVYGALVAQANALFSGADPLEIFDEDGGINWVTMTAFISRGIGVSQYGQLLSPSEAERTAAVIGMFTGPAGSYLTMYLAVLSQAVGLPFSDDFDAALDKLADTSIRAVRRSVPGHNLTYAKLAQDHLIWLQLQQMFAPDTLDRRVERQKDLYGADYWYDPREDLPERLPLQDN